MKEEKRAIVIGASSGIGREVALLLKEQGWTLGVAARRVELLQDLGAQAAERIDVTSDEATAALSRLITPCTELARKLSLPDFIVRR